MNLDIVLFLIGLAFFLLSTDLVTPPALAKRGAWLRALILLGFLALLQLMLHPQSSSNSPVLIAHQTLV